MINFQLKTQSNRDWADEWWCLSQCNYSAPSWGSKFPPTMPVVLIPATVSAAVELSTQTATSLFVNAWRLTWFLIRTCYHDVAPVQLHNVRLWAENNSVTTKNKSKMLEYRCRRSIPLMTFSNPFKIPERAKLKRSTGFTNPIKYKRTSAFSDDKSIVNVWILNLWPYAARINY